jgi:GDSL-like Lipase/Acylhydrolase family
MRRDHIFSILTVIASCVICAVFVEFYVRAVVDDGLQFDLEMWKYARDLKRIADNPLIGHEHVPNSAAHLMGVDVKINSNRLRDREIPYQRDPSRRRILMLGDSITFGWGVPVDETSAKRIERLSATRSPAVEVINAGVGNYNTIMEVEYFLQQGYKFQPDIVILNYFINDAEPVPSYPTVNFLRRNCYSCIFLTGRIDILMRQFSARPDWSNYYLDLYGDGNAKGWLDAKASIGKLADYCKLHNVKVLIAVIPELHDLKHYRFGKVADMVHRTAEENGVEFLDLLPALESAEPAKLWVTPSDAHPNGYANELIAEVLFRKLETMR